MNKPSDPVKGSSQILSGDQATPQTTSSISSQIADDIASEGEVIADITPPGSKQYRLPHDVLGQQTSVNTTQAPAVQPYNQGEQSISGSAPDPDSDDDTLANAQAVGMQLGEDEEHPQEIDIARDVVLAELAIRDQ